MFSKNKLIVAGMLVLVLLVAGLGSAIALAQGPTPTPPTQSGKKNFGQLYLDALAKRLGMGTDKLQQNMQDARKDALSDAVKKGWLTQAQADKLAKQPGAFQQMRERMKTLRDRNARIDNALKFIGKTALEGAAKALGMKPEDVLTALRNGKTLADLAQEKKVDQAKVKQAIIDAEKATLDQAVKSGKITQARADQLKAKLDPAKIDLNKKHFEPSKLKQQIEKRWGAKSPK